MVLVHRLLEPEVGQKLIPVVDALLAPAGAPGLREFPLTAVIFLPLHLIVQQPNEGESGVRDVADPTGAPGIGVLVDVVRGEEYEDQNEGLGHDVGHVTVVEEAADHKSHGLSGGS